MQLQRVEKSMYDINIANQQTELSIDCDFILNAARKTLEIEQVTAATISLAIVNNQAIHAVNRQFLQHDYPTDVISFLLDESGGTEAEPLAATGRAIGKTLDGEIIVSAEYARDVAPEFGTQPHDELALYVIHGLLHLCGYDDLTDDELPLMRARERVVLRALNINIPPRDDE
jgi:probable rRNA maturation factor